MIRNRLKHYRHKHEMNQKQFAEYLQVRQEQISRWERQKEQPTIDNAFKICRKLNISMDDLFDYSPK